MGAGARGGVVLAAAYLLATGTDLLGGDADDAGAEAAGLTGTWRVFLDDTEDTPVYDIPFDPVGPVAVVYEDALPWTVTTWTFGADGSQVTVTLQCEIESGDGTLVTWPEKLELTLDDEEMRGTWSGEQWEYTPDDDTPEVERLGWAVNAPAVYARPVD